jgi:hypothetical protein
MTPINQKFLILSTHLFESKAHIAIPANATHMIFNGTSVQNTWNFATFRNIVGGTEYDVPIIPGFPYAFKAATVACVQSMYVVFLQVTN